MLINFHYFHSLCYNIGARAGKGPKANEIEAKYAVTIRNLDKYNNIPRSQRRRVTVESKGTV